jgi:hypothetical protein
MSTEENKAIVRRWFEEVINEKRLDGAAGWLLRNDGRLPASHAGRSPPWRPFSGSARPWSPAG